MPERFLLLALTALLLFALSGCVVADGIAHVVKLTEQSQQKGDAPPPPAPAAAPAATGPEAPAPASAPRASVTTEELPPPKR